MARQLPADVYADLIQAGFDPAAATTMTAIAGAESGYDDQALADTQLQSGTWGPSYGLFGIRTLKTATGTGSDRDIARLAASPAEQAEAAYQISAGGTDFSAWSAYATGAYQRFLATTPATAAGLSTDLPDQLLAGARDIGIAGVFTFLGVALLGAGVYLLVQPHIGPAVGLAKKAAKAVAVL